jgi:hypothetical protein
LLYLFLLLFITRVSILFTGSYSCTNSCCYLLHVYLFYLHVPIVVPILVVIYCTCIYFIYRFLLLYLFLLLFIVRASILFTGSYCCSNSCCYLLHVYLFYLHVPIVVPILVVIYCTCIYFIYRFLLLYFKNWYNNRNL